MASFLPPRRQKPSLQAGYSQAMRVLVLVLFLMGLGLGLAGFRLSKAAAQEPATPDAAATDAGAAKSPESVAPDETTSVEKTDLGQASDSSAPENVPPGGVSPSGAKPLQLTIVNMVKWGGPVLWIIIGLSIFGLAMALYLFLTVTPSREVPQNLAKRALSQIRAGDLRGAYQMCEDRDELLAAVIRAGLKASGHDRYVIQEAMESEGERGSTALWQKISYLNNVGVIAPLLGLLGTVTGMIQAFNAIAFEDSQVKGIMMAISVSQAMITTAAGLIVAIPAMALYFYLRGRVIRIVAEVEAQASEMVELLTQGRE